MSGYDWDFSFLSAYTAAFCRGAFLTLSLSVLSFIIGTAAGVVLGFVIRLLPGRRVIFLFNDCVRAVPMLVLLFFVYYFPFKQILGLAAPDPFSSAVMAFSIAQAAYTIDLVRAAAENVSKRTILGAQAVGLRDFDIWRYIILPDVLRQMLPAQLAFFIGIVRLSSLASVIGCREVVYVARVAVAQNYRSLEAWLIVALVYIALVLPLTVLARCLERSRWLMRRG